MDENTKLIDLPTSGLLKRFGAGSHKPGSGSAAALQAMLSAQLLLTVIGLTNEPKRRKYYEDNLPALLKIESELRTEVLPELEDLFQRDSDLFGRAINLRLERDNEDDVLERKRLDGEATAALRPATEVPLRIAKLCVNIGKFSFEVFDYGFRHARGDSSVAANGALSALAGCLSIVELNLLSFEPDDWTMDIQDSCEVLRGELDALIEESRRCLSEQVSLASMQVSLSAELRRLEHEAKGSRSLSERDIEKIATQLQDALWQHKDLIQKGNLPVSRFDVLKPDIALKQLGFYLDKSQVLEPYVNQGVEMEVAGQIDQKKKVIWISKPVPAVVQNFTIAHELGHSLLHAQDVLHRDRPLDGSSAVGRSGDERQADKFATYFLMPKDLVKQVFLENFKTEKFKITDETAFALKNMNSDQLRGLCGNLRDLSRMLAVAISYQSRPIPSLSERFKVSAAAMAIRLEELELVEF